MPWRDVPWRDALWPDAPLCDVPWRDALWPDVPLCDVLWAAESAAEAAAAVAACPGDLAAFARLEQACRNQRINVRFAADDPNRLRALADTISVLLMTFLHLSPPASNQWKPGIDIDLVTGTYASPGIWSKFQDFYKRAGDASKTAYDMSRADKPNELKSKTAVLRTACNACHAAYLKCSDRLLALPARCSLLPRGAELISRGSR